MIKKIISSVLIALLIMQILPMSAFAEEINTEDLTEPNYTTEIDESHIIGEVLSMRDATTKHFRCSDGSYIAATYGYPVHYEKDGQWEELDFTLTANKDENGKTIYSTQDGQNYEISVPEYMIDSALSYSYNGYEISLTYQDKANQGQENKTKKAKVKKKDNGKKNLSSNSENVKEYNTNYMLLDNAGSTVTYEDVETDTSFEYEISSMGIKENIIVETQQNNYKYSYLLECGDLVPSVESDNSILLTDTETQDVIYRIEAPVMYDSAGAESTDIKIKLKEKQNSYELVIEANKQWINADDRVFPVTIDPTVRLDIDKSKIDDTYVDANSPTTPFPNDGYLYVGRNSLGLTRTYVKFTLPELPEHSMIVSAAFSIFLYESDITTSGAVMNVYDLAGQASWSSSSITWNNQPVSNEENGANSLTVIDYSDYGNEVGHAYNWDITKVAKSWFEGGTNNGLLVAPSDESIGALRVRFLSSNSTLVTDIGIPQLTISYRDTRGLEDYWSYSTYSVGDAGTAYINDYTGHLVFVRNDASTFGQRMPVTVSHIYNLPESDETGSIYSPASGLGWQLSVQQSVKPTTGETGFSDDFKQQYPYVYRDGDGTAHYLAKTNTADVFEDEDGLGLKMTYDSESASEMYIITDNNDNKMVFKSDGNITKIMDANGNTITVAYDGSKLIKVTDGAGHIIRFTDSTDNLTLTAPDTRTCTYRYTGNNLTSVTLLNSKTVTYTYDSANRMTSATASDGYTVNFSYATTGQMSRIHSITIVSGNNTIQTVQYNFDRHNETLIWKSGNQGTMSTSSWILDVKQFDNFGRLICTYEKTANDLISAANCAYVAHKEETEDTKHHIATVGEMGDSSVNLLLNPSMENGETNWNDTSISGGTTIRDSSTDYALFGKKSIKINVSSYIEDETYRKYQTIDLSLLEAETTYTASAYVNVTECNAADNGGVFLQAKTETESTGIKYHSEYITSRTDTNINDGWQRLSVTFTVPTGVTRCYVAIGITNATGTAYFDAVQLEEGETANEYNIVENSGFEQGNKVWAHPSSTSDGHFNSNPYTGILSYRLYGKPFTSQSISQTINLESDAKETDTYVISAWVKANALSNQFHEDNRDKKFGIGVKIKFSNNYVVDHFIPANFAVSDWQYVSGAFTLSDKTDSTLTPSTLTVYGIYEYQANKVNFDDFTLAKEDVPSYTYNSKGNLVSAVDNAKGNQQMSYAANNVDMTQYRNAVSDVYTYTYDSKHNLTKATSTRGVRYNYTYDDYGNVSALEVKDSEESQTIRSEIAYTTDGSLVSETTAANGGSVAYQYLDNTGVVSSVQDANENTTTYTYDSNYRLTQTTGTFTQLNASALKSAKAKYTYDTNDNLTNIKAKSNYSFTYDSNRNLTTATAGDKLLITNEYNLSTNALTKSTYNNSYIESYEYDTVGRLTALSAGTGENELSLVGEWAYDGKDRVATYSDHKLDRKHIYDYDMLGRFVREAVVNTDDNTRIFASSFNYDENNNVDRIAVASGNNSFANFYTYGTDNLPDSYSAAVGSGFYLYDGLNRLETIRRTTLPTTTYTYKNMSDVLTTTMVETETLSDNLVGTVHYTYDANGNITSKKTTRVIDGVSESYTINYTYDEFNRLYIERNGETYQTTTYKYDAWGNIAKKWVYEGTGTLTPSSDNLIKAYDYVYSSTSDTTTTWKDLLTKYDGEAIEYDAIGNPTTYRGKTMVWNGRELTGFYDSETAAVYTYDASGIRTSKLHYGETYNYYYVEGQLVSESCSQYDLIYTYDANNNLSGIKKYLADGTVENYGAVCNIFGDVIALYNSSGTLIAQYNYDTWGKLLSVTNANGTDISSTAGIWLQNSIRYRGYVYDNETGWYYLQSRYYDPDTCRFINADGMITANNNFAINLFAYADCNPLVNIDPTGTCPYNGTKEDFIRLEQGLPSVDCICDKKTLSASNGINLDDYDDDSFYNNDSKLRGRDAKRRESKQINDAFGKDRSKRERQSKDLHDSKKGKRNDDNVPYGDLTKGDVWKITTLAGCAIITVWIIANDSTAIGIVDDVFLPFLIPVVEKVFA